MKKLTIITITLSIFTFSNNIIQTQETNKNNVKQMQQELKERSTDSLYTINN